MIVIGILAVTALPKFAERSAFQERGFQDETRALLRYAQKSAVAQRRSVCVTLTTTGVAPLTIDTSTPGDGVCDAALALPFTPQGGSGLTSTPVSSFKFRAFGDTDQSANIAVTIAGTTTTVDFKTGYVY